MKVRCPLKECFRCEPERLTVMELRLCRTCEIVKMLLRFRHQDDDHANGPGMGLLQMDALETPDLTTEGRPYGIPIPTCDVGPSCLTFPKEPAFEPTDLLLEGYN